MSDSKIPDPSREDEALFLAVLSDVKRLIAEAGADCELEIDEEEREVKCRPGSPRALDFTIAVQHGQEIAFLLGEGTVFDVYSNRVEDLVAEVQHVVRTALGGGIREEVWTEAGEVRRTKLRFPDGSRVSYSRVFARKGQQHVNSYGPYERTANAADQATS